jgi:pimeloyl-ACP methyl ester carboxylesterase
MARTNPARKVGTPSTLGNSSKTLVFVHANSFPAPTYRLLFDAWEAAGFRVLAPRQLGHNPAYPVTSNWPHLRDELLAFIDQHAPGERVHLVGHSLGGYLSVLAACRRPLLAASVVLMDSPLLGGWRAQTVRAFKATGLVKRVSPGSVSQGRRWQWPSEQAALDHFASKRQFARWHPQTLRDYVRCGTEPDPASVADAPALSVAVAAENPSADGVASAVGPVRLAFKREVETRIYNTLPHHFDSLLKRHPLRAPVAFLGGSKSLENRQVGLGATRTLTQGRMATVEGPHLFPMERPVETAAAVLALIAQMSS